VYGVIGYLVAQRSHEFGIRMALGAQRASIVGLVTRRVLVISGAGVIVGLGTASIASGVMTKLLYDTQPMDVAAYAGAALALLVVAMIAALVPIMRATRVSPATTMRSE
jgi:ABC-type antimicrobial peptide transport system permease subunit